MKAPVFPNPISKKIVNIKTDYSHVTSRLFSSLSKSKQKPPTVKEQILSQTLKLSVEKVEQIGQQKYKQAMRHVEKFKKLDEQVKRRKIDDKVDSECTFKPKINNNSKYNTQARFMNISFTERNLNKSKDLSPGTNHIKQNSFTSRTNQKVIEQQPKPKKKILGQKLAQRLMNWGKDRDSKIVNKQIQVEISKTISRSSSIDSRSQRKSSTISKQKSYRKLYEKKLYITMPDQISDEEISQKNSEYGNGYGDLTTPRKSGRTNHEMARSMMSLQGANSIKTTKRKELLDSLLQEIKYDKIDEKDRTVQQDLFLKKRTKFYTQMGQSLKVTQTVGQKLLLSQTQRGQGSFYLRQAKANISKNYKKTDVLVKNNQYSKNFSMKYVNAIVLKSKDAKK